MSPNSVARHSSRAGFRKSSLLCCAALIVGVYRREGDERKTRVTIANRDLQIPRSAQALIGSFLSRHPNLRENQEGQNSQSRTADSSKYSFLHFYPLFSLFQPTYFICGR